MPERRPGTGNWKAQERRTAALLGGKRLANNGQRQADIDHPRYHIESKQRKTIPEWLKKALAAVASPGEKIPLIVFVWAPGQGIRTRRWALLDLDDHRVLELLNHDCSEGHPSDSP